MNKELHNELKKEFQLERMILFSDAIFAIAINKKYPGKHRSRDIILITL